MEINEIIEVLQAFKEGKRVVVKADWAGGKRFYEYSALQGVLAAIANGAEFEIAREPKSIWIPSFYGIAQCFTTCGFITKVECDEANSRHQNYTGAVEFREVLP